MLSYRHVGSNGALTVRRRFCYTDKQNEAVPSLFFVQLCEKECAYNASLLMCRCIRVDVALPYEVDWDRQPSGKRRFCDADIARQLSLVFASIHSVLAVGTFSRDNIYATLLYINFSAQTFFS